MNKLGFVLYKMAKNKIRRQRTKLRQLTTDNLPAAGRLTTISNPLKHYQTLSNSFKLSLLRDGYYNSPVPGKGWRTIISGFKDQMDCLTGHGILREENFCCS